MPIERHFTPEEDRKMLAMEVAGVTQREIAQQLGASKGTIGKRLQALRGTYNQATINRQRASARKAGSNLPLSLSPQSSGGRKCLRCGDVFWSTSAANRLCFACKKGIRDQGATMDA
jgi:hypothetical protein